MTRRLKTFRRLILLACAAAFVGVNAAAWYQVGSMTRWSKRDARTERPEELSLAGRALVIAKGVSLPRPENTHTPEDIGLGYERLEIESETGATLEAWHIPVESSHVTAVLFHGYGASKDTMLSVARGLADLDCSVLMLDFYGSGGSTGTDTSLGVHESLDVAAAAEFCRERWPDQALLLYGQSMGGAAVLRAIDQHGVQPDGIVVEATFDRLLSTVAARFHRMHLPATPLAHLMVFWGGVRVDGNAFAHNPVEYAGSVECPALVLQGKNDPNITEEQSRSIHDAMRGWRRYSLYVKSGHVDLQTSDPELWRSDLSELLGQI